MPTHTLIASVGFNPASVIIAARSMRPPPDGIVLLSTAQSEPVARVVAKQIGIPKHTTILVYPDNPPIEEARDFLAACQQITSTGETVLDITGATKPLCLALWLALTSRSQAFRAVYLEPSGRLRDARKGGIDRSTVLVQPEEVLEWHSAEMVFRIWRGGPGEAPEMMRARHSLLRKVFDEFSRIRIGENSPIAIFPDDVLVELAPPPGIRFHGNEVHEPPGSGLFSKGRWLEELCLIEALDALAGAQDVVGVLGAIVRPAKAESAASDEVDVVLTRGARVVVIEAKARRKATESGADLQKRIAKTKKFFGDPAKVIFVHPAYNAAAQAANTELVDQRTVRLVGQSLDEYRKAILWAVG